MSTPQDNIIPAGYMRDSIGRLIPVELVSDLEAEEDTLVQNIYKLFKHHHSQLQDLKAAVFADIQALIDLADEKHGAKIGGRKGNLTLYSYDGRIKLTRKNADDIVFGVELQAAKALIDECLHTWTDGGAEEAKILLNDAFSVDKEGKISTGKVLGLRRHKFTHPKWKQAMDAINDSIRVIGQKAYVQVFVRANDKPEAPWVNIPLDFAKV